jgi:serine protease inhibitor
LSNINLKEPPNPRCGAAQVIFNRPFFYAIRDEMTGMVLFMGAVVEP